MINNLQTLRGVAALMIFAHHFGFRSSVTESFGDCAVAIFMMLSGFVLTISLISKTAEPRPLPPFSDFILKRLARIFPLYLLGQLCMMTLIRFTIGTTQLLADIAMLQSWIPSSDYYFSGNAPSWFVCDLLFCYLLFLPSIRFITSKAKAATIALCGLLIIYAIIVWTVPDGLVHPIIYIFPPMQFPAFCIGMLCALIFNRSGSTAAPARANLLILGGIALIILQIWFYPTVSPRLSLSSYWWLSSFIIIYLLAKYDKTRCAITSILHTPLLIELGNISFAFYIFHLPFLTAWRRLLAHFGIEFHIALDFILSAAILICISVAIHKLVEIPATRYLDGRLSGSVKK